VIYNNPLLVMEDFVGEPLFSFIRSELDMDFLAGRMERLAESGTRPEEVLLLFLLECDYYTEKEISKYKEAVSRYRSLKPEEYGKARADYLFEKHQYGRAASRYEKVLELIADKKKDAVFEEKVYHNLGASYAQMFQFTKALASYEKAYELGENAEILKRIFFLSRFSPELEIRKPLLNRVKEEEKETWAREFSQAGLDAEQAGEVRALRALFKKDPIKRMNGAAAMVGKWKKEYRQMV
jgi:tetratricopeptide (TPR) repeat protein